MFMQQRFYIKYGFWNEQAKPLPKIMNQHNQRGMQSWKVKNCPHQWPTQTESGSQRGKESWTQIDIYMYREKYLKIFFSRITTLHFMIIILLFKHAHINMYSWFLNKLLREFSVLDKNMRTSRKGIQKFWFWDRYILLRWAT